MTFLVIVLPFLGSLFSGFFSRFLGRTGSSLLTTILMFGNIILTWRLFSKVSLWGEPYFLTLKTWIYSDLFQVTWSFFIDNLTITMLLVVNIVSTLVHVYSTDYMSQDPHVPRFMSYLSLFTFFMLMLVTGENLVILFLGWEGVGLCSYLLISFWYTRLQANKAAIKALIVNRVADFALTLGMVSIFLIFRTLDFHTIFPITPFVIDSKLVFLNDEWAALTVICLLLFIGAMGKSAQIGLHTWLPDAMEGPTPVSALIHAATMVTAGVFLIIKCSPIFEYVPTVLSIMTLIGATTAFFSATIGLVQNDIKKVIAYSTCSQLGYMIFACGLSNYHVSLFHLTNHAFFKALLFLSAGAIIHSLSNEQDMRKFGGLVLLLPLTSIMLLIGSLSLMGFPFLTGFYSKDLILELALTKYTLVGSFAYAFGLITAFFTSFYSFRVFYMTFIYKNNSFRSVITHVHELPWRMAFSLSVLSVGSIFLGYFAKDWFVGLGTDFWNHSLFILPEHNNQLEAEFFGLTNLSTDGILNTTYSQRWIKLFPFFLSLMAMALVCLFFSHSYLKFPSSFEPFVGKQLLNAPYFFQTDQKTLKKPWLFENEPVLKEIQFVTSRDVQSFLYLNIPTRLIKRYQNTGQFVFLFSSDDPLKPQSEIVSRPQYYFYQKFLWDLYSVKDLNFSLKDGKFYWRELYSFLTYKWYFDAVYNELINRPLLNIAYQTVFSSLDKGLFEWFGPYGLSTLLSSSAHQIKRMQVGQVYYYAYFILIFLFVLLVVLNNFNDLF